MSVTMMKPDANGQINFYAMPATSIVLPGENGPRARLCGAVNLATGRIHHQIPVQGGVFRLLNACPPDVDLIVSYAWYRPLELPRETSENAQSRGWLLRGGLIHEKLSLATRVDHAKPFVIDVKWKNPDEFHAGWRRWVRENWRVDLGNLSDADVQPQAPGVPIPPPLG